MKIVQWLFLLFVLMRVQPSFGMDGSHKKRNMLLGAGAVALVGAGGALTYWHMHNHEEPDLVRGTIGVSEAIPPEGQSHWKRNALIGGGILTSIAAGVVYVRGFWGGAKKGPAGDGQGREAGSSQLVDALGQSAGESDPQSELNAIAAELDRLGVADDPALPSALRASEAGDGGHGLDQVGASGVQSPGAPKPESPRQSIEGAMRELSPVGSVEGVHEALQEPAQPAAVVTTLRAVSPALEPQYAAQDELAAIETGLNDRNVSDVPYLHVNEDYLAQLSQDLSITQCVPPDCVSMELPLHQLIFKLNQLIVSAGGDCTLVCSGDLSQDDGPVSQAQRLKQRMLFSQVFQRELSYYLERLHQLQEANGRGQLG